MADEMARVLMEVVAGILPGTPEPEFTKRWAITSSEWEAADGDGRVTLLNEAYANAQEYARGLVDPRGEVGGPNRLNWVRVDWLWL